MNVSLLYCLILLIALVMVGLFRRPWLLALWAMSFLLCPTATGKISEAPIYIYDLVTVMVFCFFLLSGDWNRWPPSIPRWHWWFIGLAFLLSVVLGAITYGFSPALIWIWGHSSLAWMGFAFGIIITTSRQRTEYRSSLQWGLIISAAVLAVIAAIQYFDLPGSASFASFFYGSFGGESSVETLRVGLETNRANGPHFAPTTLSGMALLSGIAFWLISDDDQKLKRILVLTLCASIMICTVSRHALLAAVLGVGVMICLSESRQRAKLVILVAIAGIIAVTTLGGLVGNSWKQRLLKSEDGLLNDDNIAARVLWGPERLAEFISHHPSVLLTGAGLDPEKLAAKSNLDPTVDSGFVSNGFLLSLYYLGVPGFLLYGSFWLWTAWVGFHSSRCSRGVMCGFVVMSAVIVASDNYGFMYEPAVSLVFLIVGLIAGQRHFELAKARSADEPEVPTGSVAGIGEKDASYAH
jgi:hypothetical protein